MTTTALCACAALLAGCASTGGSAGGSTGGIGHLDARLVGVASSHATTDEVELRADAAGNVSKLSVHHADAATIPEAVRKLAEATFPGGKPVHYETELYADTGMAWEVEVDTADGKRCEVSASEAGLLRYTECRITVAELPEPVAKTLAATLPDAAIEEIEVVKGPAVDQFRIEAKVAGRVHYLRVSPSGAVEGHTLRVPANLDVPLP